jgi:hypothetical protein
MNFRQAPPYRESVVAAFHARRPHPSATATAIFRHGGSVGGTSTECRSRLLADGIWTPRGGWDSAPAYECGASVAVLVQCLGLVESPGDPRARRRASPATAPSPTKSAVGQVRGILAERVIVSTALDPFLPLRALVAYSGIGLRRLYDFLSDPVHPLPHYRVGGKILVRRSEFDAWIAHYRRTQGVDVGGTVNDVLQALNR